MEEKIKELEEKVDFLYKNRLEEKNDKRYWIREHRKVKNLIVFLNWLDDKRNNYLKLKAKTRENYEKFKGYFIKLYRNRNTSKRPGFWDK